MFIVLLLLMMMVLCLYFSFSAARAAAVASGEGMGTSLKSSCFTARREYASIRKCQPYLLRKMKELTYKHCL